MADEVKQARNFRVQIAETRNYEIDVEAADDAEAGRIAHEIWLTAPEVGGYEIPDTSSEVVAVTRLTKATQA